MTPLRAILCFVIACLGLLSGCGHGSPPSLIKSTAGRATFTVFWPQSTRLIPQASNSILIQIQNGPTVLATQTLARPAGGGPATASFASLPVGQLTATATAYPNANGTGTPQAQASVGLNIQANQTATFSLTMATTIASVSVLPGQKVGVGGTKSLSFTALDAAGNVVIVASAEASWAVATGQDKLKFTNGQAQGLAAGTAGVTVTVEGVTSPVQSVTVASGSTSFMAPVNYTVPGANYVTVADLDGDGKLDIAVGDSNGAIEVFYGNGDGTFGSPHIFPASGQWNSAGGTWHIVAADLNGDGKLDLIATGQKVAVLINTGNRSFAPAVYYQAGSWPAGVTVNDFNGDGKPDMAVANNSSNDLYIFLNNGDGTFGSPTVYGAGSYPGKPVSADFNGDGKIDIAVPNYVSGNVLIYLGDGTGKFVQQGNYAVGSYPAKAVLGDFNGDGKIDIATGNTFSNTVSVLISKGDGTFAVQGPYPANQYPHMLDVGDFNGDGRLDIAVPNNGTNYFTILTNTGNGAFSAPVTVTSGGTNTRTLAVGDFNGDGLPDIVVGNEDSNSISVFINNSQ
jgi:hypothetical protein